MPSVRGSEGADPRVPDHAAEQINTVLVEALMHLLIEKGVLTKNDALSVVQTAAQVERGRLHESGAPTGQMTSSLRRLERMYESFEAVEDRPGVLHKDAENIHRLRPPLHGDRPEFPRAD